MPPSVIGIKITSGVCDLFLTCENRANPALKLMMTSHRPSYELLGFILSAFPS
jgi:hypothetical protein